jgi:hypothetical protein
VVGIIAGELSGLQTSITALHGEIKSRDEANDRRMDRMNESSAASTPSVAYLEMRRQARSRKCRPQCELSRVAAHACRSLDARVKRIEAH